MASSTKPPPGGVLTTSNFLSVGVGVIPEAAAIMAPTAIVAPPSTSVTLSAQQTASVMTSLLGPGANVVRKARKRPASIEALDSDDDMDWQGSAHGSSVISDGDSHYRLSSPVARQNHSEIEKRRRDKMNTYITELSTLIPMCSAMNRKLDKLTVLRMAVQHINSLKGSSKVCSEISDKPTYISDDELKQLILNVSDGFLFVVGCDRGRVLYVSQSVKDVLQYSQSDLIGQSLFDILHPRDISKVKEQLSSSDLTPRERLIDAKTMLPVKTEYPQKPTHLCSGARRSFFCQMKSAGKVSADLANSVKVKKELDIGYNRKRKSERRNYKVIHCTGYLKSWSKAKIGLDEDSEADNDCSILNCLVAVGREQHSFNGYNSSSASEEGSGGHIKVRSMEYMSRHNVDGKFTYVDERATVILGYLPQELLGTSMYEYFHQDDIPALGQVHRKVLSSKEKIETDIYRFKLKNNRFLHLKSRCFSFRNPWTKEVEYIVSTNTVVQMQEVTSSGQLMDQGMVSMPEQGQGQPQEFTNIDNILEPLPVAPPKPGGPSPTSIPGMLGATLAGAGRIGKQIAHECMEQIKVPPIPADSSNHSFKMQVTTSSSSTTAPSSSSSSILPPPNAPTSTSRSHHSSSSNLSSSLWLDVGGHPLMTSDPNINNIHSRSQSDDSSTDCPLIESVMQEQTMDNIQNPGNDMNDEAALAFLMSLLEADAGLGGPVDFNDLPWPL